MCCGHVHPSWALLSPCLVAGATPCARASAAAGDGCGDVGAGEHGLKRAAGLSGEAEGTGTSGEDLLPNAALPFELQNHRHGAADRVPFLLYVCVHVCKGPAAQCCTAL